MEFSVCVAALVTAVMELCPCLEEWSLSGTLGGDFESRAARILDSLSLVLVDTSLIIVDFVLDDGIMIGTLRSHPVIENCIKVLRWQFDY